MRTRPLHTVASLATVTVVLMLGATTAIAHGVTVTADVGGGMVAELKLTDETGDICYTLTLGEVTPDGAHIHRLADGEQIADLPIDSAAAGGDEVCVRLDVAVVEEILADVDAFAFDVHGPGFDSENIAPLRKPRPPGFDLDPVTDASASSDGGWSSRNNVFGVAAGIALIVAAFVVGTRVRLPFGLGSKRQ